MKSILMSIRPQHLEKILNGDATMLLRKRVPKDYIGWCYIRVNKGNYRLYQAYKTFDSDELEYRLDHKFEASNAIIYKNSTIPARFWLNECELTCGWRLKGNTGKFAKRTEVEERIPKDTCLSIEDIIKYAGGDSHIVYAIHINQLEIFNVPKSLGEFKKYIPDEEEFCNKCGETYFDYSENTLYCTYVDCDVCPKMFVTNTPKNYIFVEVQDV